MIKRIIFSFFILLVTSPVFANEKVIVLLDWFLNPDHAPLFVAQQQGFFKSQGLDVELIGPADPSDPPKLVAAGKADIAVSYEPQFMQQVDQGLPLIAIGTLINHPLNCLAVLKSSSIQSLHDLKGKRVGYSTAGVDSMMLKTMLEKNGLTLDDVEKINVHYDLTQALLAKKVDGVTGIMRTFEVLQMQLNHEPVRTFYPEDNGVPTYDELIFVINKSKSHDPRWKKFLTAVTQGQAYLQAHPEDMWNAYAKLNPENNNTLNQQAWMATLPYFSKHPEKINIKEWNTFAEFMYQNKLLKTTKTMNNFMITQ